MVHYSLCKRTDSDKNLLEIENMEEQEWFSKFQELDSPLTKCLLLIAVLESQSIIVNKEKEMFKRLVFMNSETRNKQIIAAF